MITGCQEGEEEEEEELELGLPAQTAGLMAAPLLPGRLCCPARERTR